MNAAFAAGMAAGVLVSIAADLIGFGFATWILRRRSRPRQTPRLPEGYRIRLAVTMAYEPGLWEVANPEGYTLAALPELTGTMRGYNRMKRRLARIARKDAS